MLPMMSTGLAISYLNGKGVKKDKYLALFYLRLLEDLRNKEAKKLLESLSSNLGYKRSAPLLSKIFESRYKSNSDPKNRKLDIKNFLRWLKLSAIRCDNDSALKLSKIYKEGELVSKDNYLSKYWLNSTCEYRIRKSFSYSKAIFDNKDFLWWS